MTADDTAAGPCADATEVVPPATQAAPELAWSADDDFFEANGEDERRYSWGDAAERASVILLIAVAIAISIGLLTWFGFWVYGQLKPVPMPPGLEPPSAAATILPTGRAAAKPPVDDNEYVAAAISPAAIGGRGNLGGSGTAGSQKEADRIALSECHAATKSDDCVLVNAGMYHGCVSYAIDGSSWVGGSGANAAAAQDDALRRIGAGGYIGWTHCSTPPGNPAPAPPATAAAPLPPGFCTQCRVSARQNRPSRVARIAPMIRTTVAHPTTRTAVG